MFNINKLLLRFVATLNGVLSRPSITKIQFKDREQPPVEKNYTDLDKVHSELFRPLVKNYLPLFSVVFSSLKRHTFTSKNRLPLIGSAREE